MRVALHTRNIEEKSGVDVKIVLVIVARQLCRFADVVDFFPFFLFLFFSAPNPIGRSDKTSKFVANFAFRTTLQLDSEYLRKTHFFRAEKFHTAA